MLVEIWNGNVIAESNYTVHIAEFLTLRLGKLRPRGMHNAVANLPKLMHVGEYAHFI